MIHLKTSIHIRVAISLWVSFVSAAVATMIFFAMFDPQTLGHITTWPISLSRIEGYTLGFFFFWMLTSSTALMTILSLPKEKNDE